MTTTLKRDTFIKIVGAAGVGLTLGFTPEDASAAPQSAVFLPNAYIQITPDGLVTVLVSKSEMGQGVLTGMPMTIAEELDYPFERMRIEQSPSGPAFYDPVMHEQATHGSKTTPNMTEPLRKMGATARAMLVAAAAQQWSVPAAGLVTKGDGYVTDPGSGRSASYGELALLAALQPVPADVKLKPVDQFHTIGQRKKRVDVPLKVNGRAKYGMDVKLPGMLYASVQKPPVFGGKVASYDASDALKVKGVKKIVQISSGVAVLADNTWSAMQGRYKLKITYDDGQWANLSSAQIFTDAAALAKKPGAVAKNVGNADAALAGPDVKTVSALYRGPYLAHAAMEPMNTTAWVHDGIVEIWSPTQHQTQSQLAASRITGVPLDKVSLTTMFLGGGFGRKGETDAVEDAVEASKLAGVPVKVVYSREDDTQHDYYRSANTATLSGAVDASGKIVAWTHHVVNTSIIKRAFPAAFKNGLDPISTGGATKLIYDIPNMRVEYTHHELPIPVGFWRAPGANWNAFAVESFVDELAHAAGMDPYQFRRANIKDTRGRAVLDALAEKAGWGKPLPRGIYRGIAIAQWDDGYAGEVVEASFEGSKPRVHRIVIACDAGIIINPDIAEAQLMSAALYGLSAAINGKITIEKGRVVQNNFYDYTVLRHADAPKVEIVLIPSKERALGIGELSTPAIAPAFANAYFAATGKRLRTLPFTDGVNA